MTAKLTRLIHKIAIQLHLVAETCTICSYRSRRPVRKLLDKLSYKLAHSFNVVAWRNIALCSRCAGGRVGYIFNMHCPCGILNPCTETSVVWPDGQSQWHIHCGFLGSKSYCLSAGLRQSLRYDTEMKHFILLLVSAIFCDANNVTCVYFFCDKGNGEVVPVLN
jgi:hypothetical protein